MQTPNYTPGQFVTASLLNTSQGLVSSSLQDIASGLFTPGLIAPSALSFTFNNSLSVGITAPKPFRLLTSGGVLASANGTTSGTTSDAYTVSFSPLVPSSGSITAYIVASTLQIGQDSVAVIGPPIGHPDYNPANAPATAYTNLQDSIAFSTTTTAPDNITYYEIARTTLTAGQTSVTALTYSDQPIVRPVQVVETYNGNPTGNVAGIQGSTGVQPSLVWDTADNLLWICTTTGTAATAVWTACAQLNGSTSETFNVANATASTEAVALGQAEGLFAAINGSASEVFSASPGTTGDEVVNISQFAFDTGNPGYVKLPNGFILQWGLTNSIGIGTQAQTFVIAFPNACLSVVATDTYSGSAPGETTFGVNSLSKTGFNLGSSGPASTASAFWWALGY